MTIQGSKEAQALTSCVDWPNTINNLRLVFTQNDWSSMSFPKRVKSRNPGSAGRVPTWRQVPTIHELGDWPEARFLKGVKVAPFYYCEGGHECGFIDSGSSLLVALHCYIDRSDLGKCQQLSHGTNSVSWACKGI